MKRLVLLLLPILLFSVFTVSAQDATPEPTKPSHEYGDWTYITNMTGITLTAYRGNAKALEIPDSISGIKVTALEENLFKNNSTLKSVFIPDTVRSIGSNAFYGCTALESVRLPSGLSTIESYTFRYCTALKSIDLPEGLNLIGSYAFSGCISLASVIIPDSVSQINDSAFEDCEVLEHVVISTNLSNMGGYVFKGTPWLAAQTDEFVIVGDNVLLKWNGTGSVVDIPYGITMIVDAFEGNLNLETVRMPASVNRIGANSFRDAVNLKDINIPDSVTRIGSSAFQGCRSLRVIELPDSITGISASAFRECEKLTGFTFPRLMTYINSNVLGSCTALTDVVIPSGVQTIHVNAFYGSPNVRLHVTYDSEGERFAIENEYPYTYYLQRTKDFIYSKNEDGIQILQYIGNLFDVDIPAEIDGLPVNRINTAAFQNNPIAKRVTIPDSVTTIGDWAFSFMDNLESVKLPSRLKSLGADAFTGSVLLKSVTIPAALENIGVEPFAGIEDLEIIADPQSDAYSVLQEMGYVLTAGDGKTVDLSEKSDDLSDSESSENVETTAVMSTEPADRTAVVPSEIPAEVTAVVPTAAQTTAVPTLIPTAAATLIPTVSATSTPIPTAANTPVPTYTAVMTPTTAVELKSSLRIEDGVTSITSDMLENTAEELTLIIPESVVYIDEAILDGHTLTIVSSTNTEAEKFARKWDIKFLLEMWYDESDSIR